MFETTKFIDLKINKEIKNDGTNLGLKKLSDQSLLLQTKNLVQKERNITIQVLQHLSEIEFRKLYLKRGFSSLFDYTVKELGYSEGSAYRRIKAMKLYRDMPEATSKLKTGKLNLTTASKLQTFFEKQSKKAKKAQTEFEWTNQNSHPFEVDKKCRDEKNYESDNRTVVLDLGFKKLIRDERSGEIQSGKATDPKQSNTELQRSDSSQRRRIASYKDQKLDLLKKVEGKSGSQMEKILCEMDPEMYQIKDKVRYLNKDQVEIKLSLDKNTYDNLERLKSLLSHKNPNMSYKELFKILSELGLNTYNPIRKLKRQNNKKSLDLRFRGGDVSLGLNKIKITKSLFSNIKNKATEQRTHSNKENNNSKNIKKSRYIPAQIKRLVWNRDQGQCTYICPETKKKCGSKHLIQIDHIHPYSLGGDSD